MSEMVAFPPKFMYDLSGMAYSCDLLVTERNAIKGIDMKRYEFDPVERAILERSPIPQAVYQRVEKWIEPLVVSDGMIDFFGLPEREAAVEWIKRDMYANAHPDDASRVANAGISFADGQSEYNIIYRNKRHDEYRVVHAQAVHEIRDGIQLAHVWYMDEGPYLPDAPGEKKLNPLLSRALQAGLMERRSRYDELTGLPNMTYFLEMADVWKDNMQAEGRTAVMLYVNLIGMKHFNGRNGFAEGDRMLCKAAKLLSKQFGNEHCSRFFSDHFGVYTVEEDLDDKLHRILREWSEQERDVLPMRIGIYTVRIGDVNAANACDRAKYACDKLRSSYSSGYVRFDEEMLARERNRQHIVEHLDQAIREKWIKVYYQPIVRTTNGHVCDEEALARWVDPEMGFLSPAEFIPALEDAKLIYKLDLYVTERILEKMKRQREKGLYVVPISVNLSRSDFESCDIVEEIRRRVDAAGIERKMLSIEITESIVGNDFDFIREQIRRFQELGFPVWMDDFGSGYSSLDVLGSLRFDVIKFDMKFMQEFDKGKDNRIILTEMIKLAVDLGLDTVCEGVERQDQLDFLKEAGCSKIQGYFFCKPIPEDEIWKRYEKGTQIGFENPESSGYYSIIGGFNLYDLSTAVNREDEANFRHYFDALPMAIIESSMEYFSVLRCNQPYRDFMMKTFGISLVGVQVPYSMALGRKGEGFVSTMRQCAIDGKTVTLDEEMEDGSVTHAFIRRIARNPVNGMVALATAVLSVAEARKEDSGLTFIHVAKALSADYRYLYYVNLDTEEFVEYSTGDSGGDLALERHGTDFFEASRRDALRILYEPDQMAFCQAFNPENVLKTIDEQGSFNQTYRQVQDGRPVYMAMKAVRLEGEENRLIVGISNVDIQMKERQELHRQRDEQQSYRRLSALGGDYLVFYTVDLKTSRYLEYSASENYSKLGINRTGSDFFGESLTAAEQTVYPEDREIIRTLLNREKMLEAIDQSGVFSIRYRLLLGGEPKYVNLRAARVEEKDGPRIIVGVSNVDQQVRREMRYEEELRAARDKANIDLVTGVKNPVAYANVESQLNDLLIQHQPVEFAIAVCKVQGLLECYEQQGEETGNRLLRQACFEVCNIFKRSPVFRMGKDRFVVICRGHDYEVHEELMKELCAHNRTNNGLLISCGMATNEGDLNVASVFRRAQDVLGS